MRNDGDTTTLRSRAWARLSTCALALMLLAPVAAAQQSIDPPAVAAVPPEPESRGLFESIGRWMDQGAAGFRSHLTGARNSAGTFNEQATVTGKNLGDAANEIGKNAVGAGVTAMDITKDAVGAVAKLPLTRVVNGRERCPQAVNGAPDCLAAAEALCRKQGYTAGKSLDFTSAEQCSARTVLSGRQAETDCYTVTFISRAMCQ